MAPVLRVLADANVLVQDVVSYVFYDLTYARLLDLRWTPQIEAEYTRHRARLRAQANQRPTTAADLFWAAQRLAPIKRWLVPHFLPPHWDSNGERLHRLEAMPRWAALLNLPDPDDVHVALAAADWAAHTGEDVLLATANLQDLPADQLEPFGVHVLHPGDVLELVYRTDPSATAASLLKTTADFKNPAFTPEDMLRAIRNPQQFFNPELADELQACWMP
jgi:hypothetical protein